MVRLPFLVRSLKTFQHPCPCRMLCTAVADKNSATQPPRWLLVGLGNPGNKFHGTRHNVGFEMIDAISEAEGIKLSLIEHQALTGKGEIGGVPVLLAKPQTYANLSGESVGPLAAHYEIPAQQIVVLYDDLYSEVTVTWLLAKGGPSGHNGVKSIMKALHCGDRFARFRIGIGKPPGTMDSRAYVLQMFNKEERELIDITISCGVIAIRLVATKGLEEAIKIWNETRKRRFRAEKKKREELKMLNQT